MNTTPHKYTLPVTSLVLLIVGVVLMLHGLISIMSLGSNVPAMHVYMMITGFAFGLAGISLAIIIFVKLLQAIHTRSRYGTPRDNSPNAETGHDSGPSDRRKAFALFLATGMSIALFVFIAVAIFVVASFFFLVWMLKDFTLF